MTTRSLAIVLLTACLASPAAAEDYSSGNYLLVHCRLALRGGPSTFAQGICLGNVSAINYVARFLPPWARSCQPVPATDGQAVRVVIAYLEVNPARLHEDFRGLTIEALREAWPCPGE